ncbi:nuclear transcription factor Y subunit gamma-like [Episyrphus balteatus]|uniref:nuclear transcription factor Y subunit gamma-like n=1 Tax=Episyrphus balteatus TaxID=286459 RepID=UPI0024859218|nr:nuclear transcription factor Y subunit gamma-like [Episyrphus balteatus]
MPKLKRAASPFDVFDDDFDEDASSNSSKNGNPPIQRNAANARERARMRVLSSAFGRLKTKLPNIPPDTKLSKLDTLRLATIYIKQLKTLLEGGTDESMDVEPAFRFHQTPQSMTWPFTFQHIQASRQLTSHYAPMEWTQPEKYSNDIYRNHNLLTNNNNNNNNTNLMNNNISNTNHNNNNNTNNNMMQSHSSCLFDHHRPNHGHVIH